MAPWAHAQVVPAEFVRDRIFVVGSAAGGERVLFFTDTGGGWNAISAAAQERLKLPPQGDVEIDGRRCALVDASALFERSKIPAPVPDEPWLRGMLVVAPADQLSEGDGTLGSRWFAGHVWDLDYGRQQMKVLPARPALAGFHEVPMGFVVDENGRRALNFPRITVSVDGQQVDVLLDTGASARLTPGSARVLGFEAGTEVGTSFVIRSIFEQWRAAHPQWRTIPNADARGGSAMIEVPTVRIGGIDVGPVWFTMRPDSNFLEFMSQMTDQAVSGAIGGSALKYLHVVLDYPAAKMYVEEAVAD